jgi:signal recognition particle subunit SRP54
MLPGFGQMKQLKNAKVDERELDRIEAIVTSMTLAERRNPKIIDGSRRKRIAIGSGTSVQAVNQLVKQFAQMQKMMRSLQQGKMPSMEQLMRGGM